MMKLLIKMKSGHKGKHSGRTPCEETQEDDITYKPGREDSNRFFLNRSFLHSFQKFEKNKPLDLGHHPS
jgi:hypothetical protein